MAAATVSQPITRRAGNLVSAPVAASTKILQGCLVCLNAAGYAVQGSDTANLRILGVATEEVDNTSGSNGDLNVQVERGVFLLENDADNPITLAEIGTADAAVIHDNQTACVAAGATNDIPIGKPLALDDNGVWVEIL